MRDLALATVVFGLLPFVIWRPFWGILMLTWLGYMNPHLLCYGFMQTMPVVLIVAIATLMGMLVSKEAKRMIWSREVVCLVLFVAWMGITTTQAFYVDRAVEQYIKVIKIQILTVMALLMLTSRERIHLFIWVIVLSLGFYGIKGGIFTIVNGGEFRVQGPSNSFIGGNNELALALVMTIPLMRYLHLHEQNKLIKSGLVAAMVLTTVAAVGSQSRGALVGLALTGTLFWWKSRNKVGTGLLIAMAVMLAAAVMPEEWYQRMNTIETYDQDDSALGRINAWKTAWNLANHRFLGGGFEMWHEQVFQLYAPDPTNVHDAHSIYFKVLGEHGYVGLFLFLSLLAMTWFKCRTVIRLAKHRPDALWASDLAAMVQVSMVGYMSAGAFLGLSYFDYIYHLVAVAVVVHYLLTVPQPASDIPARSGVQRPATMSRLGALRQP
jgi:putative inorganic carbon (HCO3(-)) transporter